MVGSLDIAGSLAGQRLFLTGGTGFIGKVLIERLLWSVPDVDKVLVLVRPSDGRSASERFASEVLAAPLMRRVRAWHGERWSAWVDDKIEVIEGDLDQDRFGLDRASYERLCGRIDRIVGCAASVTFDERLDRAIAINTHGAARTLALACDAGHVPLVHVSTCFVSGRRTGWIAEEPVEIVPERGPFDLDRALSDLDHTCRNLWASPAAADDAHWVAAGRLQARRYGFHDVYTLTKALAEQLVLRDRGTAPLAIVRPAIVESAVEQPIPGWIEAVRVADPLLVAYGRGRTTEIPGAADVPMELVPVDYVAHAILAALADLPPADTADEPRIVQVGSSRHPITLGELMTHARDGFAETPWRDEDGQPVTVEAARFVEPDRLADQLATRLRSARRAARWAATLGASDRARRWSVAARGLEHFARLIDVYRPYLGHGARYRDDATLALWNRLTPEARATFPFDVTTIDWADTIAHRHVPGLLRFALGAETGAPPVTEPTTPFAERQAAAEARAADAATIFELFAATAEAHPDVMAFQICRAGRWLRYTYARALTTTTNLAWRLATGHGIGAGDRVVLWSTGCPEWTLTALAVHRLGATIVPLDPQWPADEIARAAHLVEAKLVCAAPTLVASWPSGESLPIVGLAEPWVPAPDVPLLPGAAEIEVTGEASDLASILFTSGTTVAPKSVPLTHANLLSNVRDLVPLMHLSRDRLLSVLPIHHAFEQMVGHFVPIAGASTISYVAKLEPTEINWMMNTTRPTVLVAVPRLLELLHGGIERSIAAGGPALRGLFKVLFALSRLSGGRHGHRLFAKVHRKFGGSLRRIATGGTALRPDLGQSFFWMGFRVAEGYGMTETSPVLTVNPWSEIRFGSVGRPLPDVEIELRPPADASGVEPGAGEVWVRGGNVMSGYFGDPSATAEVMADGWLNTGDIGAFDDGFLRLSGRTKDVILTAAGKNVYPEEVEARYRDLPGVEELVVLGLPQGTGGERVVALVVPLADADTAEIEAAIDARSAEVPSYQRVAGIEIWRGDLPKTTTMKVRRAVLRDAVLAGERGAVSEQPTPPRRTEPAAELDDDQTWIVETVARLTRTRPDQLAPEDRLADLGVDSLCHVELIGAIEARFDRRVDDATVSSIRRVGDLFGLA